MILGFSLLYFVGGGGGAAGGGCCFNSPPRRKRSTGNLFYGINTRRPAGLCIPTFRGGTPRQGKPLSKDWLVWNNSSRLSSWKKGPPPQKKGPLINSPRPQRGQGRSDLFSKENLRFSGPPPPPPPPPTSAGPKILSGGPWGSSALHGQFLSKMC